MLLSSSALSFVPSSITEPFTNTICHPSGMSFMVIGFSPRCASVGTFVKLELPVVSSLKVMLSFGMVGSVVSYTTEKSVLFTVSDAWALASCSSTL